MLQSPGMIYAMPALVRVSLDSCWNNQILGSPTGGAEQFKQYPCDTRVHPIACCPSLQLGTTQGWHAPDD